MGFCVGGDHDPGVVWSPRFRQGDASQTYFEVQRHSTISTGEILRAECRAGSVLGKAACGVLANGGLLDDATMNAIVAKRLKQPDCVEGFILDGYPRTVRQAEAFSRVLEEAGLPDPVIVHLHVPDAVLVERLSSRRYCPACGRTYHLVTQPPTRASLCDGDGEALLQRSDDEAGVVAERLEAYYRVTQPLIEYYRGPHYYRVDGAGKPQEIMEQIEATIMADNGRENYQAVPCRQGH